MKRCLLLLLAMLFVSGCKTTSKCNCFEQVVVKMYHLLDYPDSKMNDCVKELNKMGLYDTFYNNIGDEGYRILDNIILVRTRRELQAVVKSVLQKNNLLKNPEKDQVSRELSSSGKITIGDHVVFKGDYCREFDGFLIYHGVHLNRRVIALSHDIGSGSRCCDLRIFFSESGDQYKKILSIPMQQYKYFECVAKVDMLEVYICNSRKKEQSDLFLTLDLPKYLQ